MIRIPTLGRIAMMATVLVAGPAHAQRAAGWLQGDAFYHAVTNDFGDWKGVGIRAVVPAGSQNIWYGELVAQEAFHDRGIWASAGNDSDRAMLSLTRSKRFIRSPASRRS